MSKILIAPLEVLTTPDLSEPERRVLLVLYSFRGKNTENVYPGIDAIAERAGYTDKTRISKLTSSLAKKGWLEKRKKGFTGCNTYRLIMPESEARYTNLDSETNMDQKAKPNLDPEANCKEQTIEQTIEQGKGKKTKKSSTSKELTLSAWLAVILEMGEKPIPDSDTILDYADDAGIPHDFLRLAWVEFKARYTEDQKKYKDWRAVFRRAVRGNWFKLWWHDGNSYILTSVGQQGMIALNNKKRSE